MQLAVESAEELAAVIRAVRQAQAVRSDDVAGAAGVAPSFLIDVERGKSSVHIGKVFQVLRELGIQVRVDVPVELHQNSFKPRAGLKGENNAEAAWERLKPQLAKQGTEFGLLAVDAGVPPPVLDSP